jgi:hypothetical protein
MAARVLCEKGMLDRGEGKHFAKRLRIAGMAQQRLYVLTAKVPAGDEGDTAGGANEAEAKPRGNTVDLGHADPKYEPPPRDDLPFYNQHARWRVYAIAGPPIFGGLFRVVPGQWSQAEARKGPFYRGLQGWDHWDHWDHR